VIIPVNPVQAPFSLAALLVVLVSTNMKISIYVIYVLLAAPPASHLPNVFLVILDTS